MVGLAPGGPVRLYSTPGEGTHITLDLPVAVPEPEPWR
jgi:chemotaxis protein histidine kinase CheA